METKFSLADMVGAQVAVGGSPAFVADMDLWGNVTFQTADGQRLTVPVEKVSFGS